MPEGVAAYPRWDGVLRRGDRWPVIVGQELRRAWRGTWTMVILLGGLAWGLVSIIELVQLRSDFQATHDLSWYTAMLDQLRWAAVAMAVAAGAPAILRDAREGALELYLTRGVSRWSYLGAKSVAMLVLTTAIMVLPAVVYYIASLAFYEQHPAGWHVAAAWGIVYSLAWALMVSGLGLGVSCAGRSTPAAVLTVLGIFVGLHIIVNKLLVLLTDEVRLAVASPFAATEQASTWFWDVETTHAFPPLWGLGVWLGLTVLGWGLVAWRHPRVRGEGRD